MQTAELVIERQIRRTLNAILRMFQRSRVDNVLGNLGEFIVEGFHANSFGYHLAQRVLDARKNGR